MIRRRLSWGAPPVVPPPHKMNHAEAAHLITEAVEEYRGYKELTDLKCAKIRKAFFKQFQPK